MEDNKGLKPDLAQQLMDAKLINEEVGSAFIPKPNIQQEVAPVSEIANVEAESFDSRDMPSFSDPSMQDQAMPMLEEPQEVPVSVMESKNIEVPTYEPHSGKNLSKVAVNNVTKFKEQFKDELTPMQASIANNEGYVPNVYKDTKGFQTIGIGHKLTDAEKLSGKIYGHDFKNGLTPEAAKDIFDKDMAKHEQDALDLVVEKGIDPNSLSESQREAIVEMVYQMGKAGTSKFKDMFSNLKQGNIQQAANEILDSDLGKDKNTAKRARLYYEKMLQADDIMREPDSLQEESPIAVQEDVMAPKLTPQERVDERFNELKKSLGSDRTIGGGGIIPRSTIPGASDKMLRKQAMQEVAAEIEAEDADLAVQGQKDALALEKQIDERKQEIALAQKHGFKIEPDPIDEIIAQEEQVQAVQEMTPTQKQVKEERALIAEQDAKIQAAEQDQIQKIADQQKQKMMELKQIEEEDNQAQAKVAEAKKSGSSFWSNLGFIIAAGISGGADQVAGNKGNSFLNAYQKKIDQEAERLANSKKEELALRKQMWDEAMKSSTIALNNLKGAAAQQNAQKLLLEMEKMRNGVEGEQLVRQRMSSGEGLTPEEYNTYIGDDKDQAKRYFQYEGKWYRVSGSADANKVKDVLNTLPSAINGLKNLRRVADLPLYERAFSPTVRGQSKLELQSTIGKMRLELFGPGVLTETEQNIAREMIGNPTSATGILFSDAARSKIDNIIQKANFSLAQTLRTNGVNVPKKKADVAIEKMQEAFPNMPMHEIIEKVRAKGLWDY